MFFMPVEYDNRSMLGQVLLAVQVQRDENLAKRIVSSRH